MYSVQLRNSRLAEKSLDKLIEYYASGMQKCKIIYKQYFNNGVKNHSSESY